MVEVEERGLGALEEHILAGLQGLVNHAHRVGHVGHHAVTYLTEVGLGQLIDVEGQPVVHPGEHLIFLVEHRLELLAEDFRVEQVLHPDAHPHRLIGVRGTDAPLGRAQLVLAQVPLGQPVDLLVVREDQVGVARHLQAGAVDALGGEHVDLGEQHDRVDDHAIADHRDDVVVQHTRGHQLEGERLAVNHQGVAGVVAPLVAHHHRHLLGEEVGELSFSFVTPLGSDDNGRGHGWFLPGAPSHRRAN